MKKTIKITGMRCRSCKTNIENELGDLDVKADIDFNSGKTVIDFDEKKISEKVIISAIKRLGYRV